MHCWLKLNGRHKWQTVLKEIENTTKKMKKNDGSVSAQSIGGTRKGKKKMLHPTYNQPCQKETGK